jgi:hypothetical protein
MGLRKMFIFTLGAKIKNLIKAFKTRVLLDFGLFEAESCLDTQLTELNDKNLLDSASLVITPNAYKETTLYSVVPSDATGDMDVVRATRATRVNSDGLIELVPYNLFIRSEEFENGYWSKQRTSITQNVIMAPNGTMSADSLVGVSGNTYAFTGTLGVNVVSNSFVARNECTVFFYLKYNGLNRIRVMYGGATSMSGGRYVEVDLQLGIITNTGINITNPFIEDVGDGWYRVGFSSIVNASPTNNRFGVGLGDTVKTVADGVDGVYIWGAQLVDGDLPKEYLPVSTGFDIPRIDYSNGSCPSILVEPQRTNLVFPSVGNLIPINAGQVVNNAGISPDGTNTSQKVIFGNAINDGARIIGDSIPVTGNVVYTLSFYAKNILGNASFNVRIDTNTTVLLANQSIISDNTWKKYTMTFTTDASATSITNNTRLRSGFGNEILFWGFQLEVGTNVTSYIPTVASTVTRNADVIRKSGISDLIGQTEGSIYVEVNISELGSGTKNICQLSFDGSNRFGIQDTGTVSRVLILSNQFAGTTFNFTRLTLGINKLCLIYTNGTWKIFRNGVLAGQQANGIYTSNLSILQVGSGGNPSFPAAQLNDSINLLALYPIILSDAQAIQLTTL